MWLELLLRLRDGRERIRVIQPEGSQRPVLGTALPDEDERRQNVPQHWGQRMTSPRQEKPPAIEEALPVRTQTILSHGVKPEVRAALNGDVGDALPASRKSGARISLDIDLG